MKRFVEGADRGQSTLFPACLDDWIDENNPVRVIDAFVGAVDVGDLGFDGVEPAETGRPAYHPSALLKLYIYGYLNRVQSSRRLEREAGRNVEVMWLLGRLSPDHKTIADFRKDNGLALRKVCARFVELCRDLGLLATASVAIDGSKFKAVNNRLRPPSEGRAARGAGCRCRRAPAAGEPRSRPQAASEITRTPCLHRPCPPLARRRQAHRSSRAARADSAGSPRASIRRISRRRRRCWRTWADLRVPISACPLLHLGQPAHTSRPDRRYRRLRRSRRCALRRP